eukprot:2086885-Prymnesium_polylepis.1
MVLDGEEPLDSPAQSIGGGPPIGGSAADGGPPDGEGHAAQLASTRAKVDALTTHADTKAATKQT